jgi:glycosyltransferase involved in cell wall biosynthesis
MELQRTYMRILFDLASVRVGGGVEQSISVLKELIQLTQNEGIDSAYLVAQNSPIHRFAIDHNLRYYVSPTQKLNRIFFDLIKSKRILSRYKPDCVYTFFGVGLPRDKFSRRIINVAYPIICYPESIYWEVLPLHKRALNRTKALIRSALIRHRSDLTLVETETMKRRLIAFSGFDRNNVLVMPPVKGSVALLLERECHHLASSSADATIGKTYKIIFVSGVDPHKNLWRLVDAIRWVEANGGFSRRVIFQLTVTQRDFIAICNQMGVAWNKLNLEQYFDFLGPKHGMALADAIISADLMANISDLESISNNFIEAEAAEKPMLIGERDFSFVSCRVPHVVAEPHDPQSVVKAIERAMQGEFELPAKSQTRLAISSDERARILMNEFYRLCTKS